MKIISEKDSLNFLIYNTLPGTTSAAVQKSKFLKNIILGKTIVNEISKTFALELLSHMKGGPSVKVLLDIALATIKPSLKKLLIYLKHKYFYMRLILIALKSISGRKFDCLKYSESYSKAEFFTNLPDINEE